MNKYLPSSRRINRGRLVRAMLGCAAFLFATATGCATPEKCPIVFFLDGAGWYSSAHKVEGGLRDAGFIGNFHDYSWSGFLGPAHDHLLVARSDIVARGLAARIERVREKDPTGPIHLMGLSAGTAVILNALEHLPDGVMVDNVVFFSSSVSADRNLTKAMAHVKRNLYATTSTEDSILKRLAVNADGMDGPPAGRTGFRLPKAATEAVAAAYRRVINLPWQPSFVGGGWSGSHVSATSRGFVANNIAPRILMQDAHPLDRPVLRQLADSSEGPRP